MAIFLCYILYIVNFKSKSQSSGEVSESSKKMEQKSEKNVQSLSNEILPRTYSIIDEWENNDKRRSSFNETSFLIMCFVIGTTVIMICCIILLVSTYG